MEGVAKTKFEILDCSRENYLTWCNDIQLHLQSKELVKSLTIASRDVKYLKKEAKVMRIIFEHIHPELREWFIQETWPLKVWYKLKASFNNGETTLQSETRYEWQPLKTNDFTSFSNSALFYYLSLVTNAEVNSIKVDRPAKDEVPKEIDNANPLDWWKSTKT